MAIDSKESYALILEMLVTLKTFREKFKHDKKSITFTINDELYNNYNNLDTIVTQIKVQRYNRAKLNNYKKVNEALCEANKDDIINSFVSFENKEKIHIQEQMNESKDIDGVDIESETQLQYVKDIQISFKEYFYSATNFLQEYNFFKQCSNIKVETTDILCREKFSRLINKIMDRLVVIARRIIKSRYDNDKSNPTSIEYFIQNPDKPAVSYDYSFHDSLLCTTLYNFPNNTEFNNDLEMFRKYLFTLYIFVKSFPEATLFINTYLNKYIVYQDYADIHDKLLKTNIEYIQAKKQGQVLLPTSLWESIKYTFVSKKVDGHIKIPFSDYARKIAYMYDINKIINESMCYTYKLNQDPIKKWNDYCGYIFNISVDNQ